MTFAERLKQLREEAGLSQGDLAERAGMNRFGIAKLEQGSRRPTWDTVQALARALGVSCQTFEDAAADGAKEPAKRAAPKPPRKKP